MARIRVAKSQTLLEWLSTPYNAGIAGDDVSTLEKWLGVLQSTGAATSAVNDVIRFGARASRHASEDYDFGIAQQRLAAQAYAAMDNFALIPKLREEQKRVGEQRKTDNWLDEHLLRPMFQTGLPFIVEGTKAAAPGAVAGGTAAAIAGQMGPQALIPEEIITVPVAAAVGAAMSSSEWMMRQEAGAMFMELLEETDADGNPLDPEVAKLIALGVGVVNSGLELVGAKGMSKAVAPLAKMFAREGLRSAVKQQGFATAAKGFIKQYGQAIGTEVGTEMAQELVSILGGRAAQNINAAMYDVEAGNPDWIQDVPGRLLDTGIETLGAFGLFMLPGPLASFHARVSSANRGNSHHATMSRAIEEGEKSKTRQRDANAYEDLAVSALPENMRRQYIEASALQNFFQSAREMDTDFSVADMTERLGIDEMEFAHAIEMGGVVSMDTAKYLAHLSPEEQRRILPDLKADPLAMSQREYASRDFTVEARDLVRTYTPDMERAESLAREKTRITEEMIAAGRDAHQAEADASIFMAHAVTWETLYGREAYDGLERMRRLAFVRGEEGATATYHQAAMDKSAAASLEDFLRDVRAGKKEYRLEEVTPDKLREEFGVPDLVINTPYYFIRHLDRSRGKKANAAAAMALEVLARANIVKKAGHSPMGELYSAVRHNADGTSDLGSGLINCKK